MFQKQRKIAHTCRRIERNHRRPKPRQRQRQDRKIGHIAEHQPDPVAFFDSHCSELLGAALDTVLHAPPREIGIPINQRLGSASVFNSLVEPAVQQHDKHPKSQGLELCETDFSLLVIRHTRTYSVRRWRRGGSGG